LLIDKEKLTGARNDDIDAASIPDCVAELWSFFLFLHGSRQRGVDGPLPIPPSEIDALARNFQIVLTPWEAETLMLMDLKVYGLMMRDMRQEKSE
jgi:hypothetical protein